MKKIIVSVSLLLGVLVALFTFDPKKSERITKIKEKFKKD